MNNITTNQSRILYQEYVLGFSEWVIKEANRLRKHNGCPLIVPLTVTFAIGSIRTDQCLGEFERFYSWLCRKLVNNIDRPNKKHLRPFTIVFLDDPSTRLKGKRPTFFADHPEVAPHVHAVMVIHPDLAEKFLKVQSELEALWRKLSDRNTTLKVNIDDVVEFRHLMSNVGENDNVIFEKVCGWIRYSSKLQIQWTIPDCDLFTVLPHNESSSRTDRHVVRLVPNGS